MQARLLVALFSSSLHYWFRVLWCPSICRGASLPPSHPEFIHINCLEFVVALLQFAAAVVRCDSSSLPITISNVFPDGLPAFPVLQNRTDNTSTEAWYNSNRTKSVLARDLVFLYGQLLRRTALVPQSEWIAGDKNVVPDVISRPNLDLTSSALLAQTYQNFPFLSTYDFFLPSPELCSVIRLSLCSKRSLVPPQLPKNLGRFCPAESITSSSFTI